MESDEGLERNWNEIGASGVRWIVRPFDFTKRLAAIGCASGEGVQYE
jgi:hypothetical protein